MIYEIIPVGPKFYVCEKRHPGIDIPRGKLGKIIDGWKYEGRTFADGPFNSFAEADVFMKQLQFDTQH